MKVIYNCIIDWIIHNLGNKYFNDMFTVSCQNENRVGRSDFFLFRNRYNTDEISHWGPFGLALTLNIVKDNPFWVNIDKIPMKILLGMASPRVSSCFLRYDTKLFFFLGGGVKSRSVVGRETVQKHVLLFCLTGSRKASTALTLDSPSHCRLSVFPRWSRLPPPNQSFIYLRFLYWFLFIFFCCAKSKNKNTSFTCFRDVYLNHNYIYFKFR